MNSTDQSIPTTQRFSRWLRRCSSKGKCRTLLTLSRDLFVMDGHRRLTAAKLAGLTRLECIIAPIKKLAERFRQSGKETLIILTIADFDPAGIMIVRSFTQRLRDYFHIANVDTRRVALTQDQVEEHSLVVGGNINDKADVNKESFAAESGEDTYEVEALESSALEAIVQDAIEQTIDTDAYNEEIEREERDSQFLEAKRKLIMEYAGSLPSVAEDESED
jgi:ParB-like nuclease domain